MWFDPGDVTHGYVYGIAQQNFLILLHPYYTILTLIVVVVVAIKIQRQNLKTEANAHVKIHTDSTITRSQSLKH